MTSKRSASSGSLGGLDWIVLFAMGITAAAVAAGLIVHSGIAPVPSLIAAAALYMVMAASYITIVRAGAPSASFDGARLAELEEALEIIDGDLQRIDRVEEDLARINVLSERVEQIDRALSEAGASGLIAGQMPSPDQFAAEFEDVHAKIENLRADLEVETRSQREKISGDLKTLEGLMLKLSRDLTTRDASPASIAEPSPQTAARAEPRAMPVAMQEKESEPEEELTPRGVGFIETVELRTAEAVDLVELEEVELEEMEDSPKAPDVAALAELVEAPDDFYRVEVNYEEDEAEHEEAPEPVREPEGLTPSGDADDAEAAAANDEAEEISIPAPRVQPAPPAGDIATTVRQAVDAGRVDLYLQPIVTLPDRKLRYYEGLTRVRTAGEDVLKPDAYLPASEEAGIMPLVDNVLLVKSVQVLRRLPPRSKVKGIFCNISKSSLLDPDFFPELVEFMEENSGLSESLIFEINQPAYRAMSHTERASLDTLGALGYGFSLDHVTDLDIDFDGLRERFFRFVKIDAAIFLNEMEQRGAVLPTAEMKAYIEDFDLKLIVEKVEDEQAVARLLDYGVDLAQGYLFGLPRLMGPALIRELENADAA